MADVLEEVPLDGGMSAVGVVRVGDTVRRPTGPWTSTVHALLRHLEAEGFDGAPRVLGIDGQGREILTYAEGVTIWPGAPDTLATDENLARAARLVGDFHRAAAAFGEVQLLHNDLGTWNIVVGPERWVIIDWDEVAPGPIEWELAYCLHSFLWLTPANPSTDAEIADRLSIFADGYQLRCSALRTAVELIPESCRAITDAIVRGSARGHRTSVLLHEQGQHHSWAADAAYAEQRLPSWLRRLRA